jgi:alpha-1,2-glucosyltransferase
MAITDCPLYVYFTGNLILVINLIISNLISNNVKTPYMDEIFHVTQAQTYCNGNFSEWNDKITTLPGLYLLNSIPARVGHILFNLQNIQFDSL